MGGDFVFRVEGSLDEDHKWFHIMSFLVSCSLNTTNLGLKEWFMFGVMRMCLDLVVRSGFILVIGGRIGDLSDNIKKINPDETLKI